jgi:tRNA1(Val) A37 N6-methylase TrmN6
MALFQKAVLNKYLKQQNSDVVGKAYKKFSKYFLNPTIQKNIRDRKEEQFQEGFLTELFVNVLGYTLAPNPHFNLTTELKNEKGAKKADGAILKHGNALGVIELKSTKTKDLEKVRQQAFDYKANQTGCVYVITSNFEKVRFYINNAVEFEEFNLFALSKERFSLLYQCLAKENLLKNIPLKIKEASVQEEEAITKKFYQDYSTFKRELYRDLVKQNMKNEVFRAELKSLDVDRANKNIKHHLFKKSQKLIDRFLFVFFAEDRGLLPPNSTLDVLNQWDKLQELEAYIPLYERFKLYFNYLDTGRKGTDKSDEIFAYNGGLFKPDLVLDSLFISDELLYRYSKTLQSYDFDSQVDVNILGHIFENSLNEIESVNAEIEGVEFDKQKTRRKKDGVFYTPKYITKYIVDNTVGKLCNEKKGELKIVDEDFHPKRQKETKRRLLGLLEQYREWLLQLTILDPACGSGAFLNQALDFLIKEHQYLDELQTKLLGGSIVFPNIENTVLENNIYGVDLNEESVEIAKLSLWLRTAQPRRKLNNLSSNIKCGNSLIDSRAVAGDKAFKWEDEFAPIFEKGGFDVIIGNPPYVYARDIENIAKAYLIDNFKCASYQIDLYILFLERSTFLINSKGIASFIVPNTWLNNLLLAPVRSYLLGTVQFDAFVAMPSNVFEDANVDTIITTFRKLSNLQSVALYKCTNAEFDFVGEGNQGSWLKNDDYSINIHLTEEVQSIIKKMEISSVKFGEISKIIRGVGVYHKRIGHTKEFIKSDPFQSDKKEDETFVPYLRGKNLSQWEVNWKGDSYISYGNWLAEPREPRFFNGKRVLIRKILSKGIVSAYMDEQFVVDQQIYTAQLNQDNNYEEKAIIGIICSKLMSFYFRHKYSEFDDLFPQIKLAHIKGLPIKEIEANYLTVYSAKLIKLKINYRKTADRFSNYLQSQFSIDILSKKLLNWYDLEFGDFIKELNKAVKKTGGEKLTKMDEMDWMDVFETKKAEAQTLKAEIDKTDAEINAMVYELYGLSEEEIKVVEGS